MVPADAAVSRVTGAAVAVPDGIRARAIAPPRSAAVAVDRVFMVILSILRRAVPGRYAQPLPGSSPARREHRPVPSGNSCAREPRPRPQTQTGRRYLDAVVVGSAFSGSVTAAM